MTLRCPTDRTRRATHAGVELESQEKLSLLEWLANEYKRFGCQLECVSAPSPCALSVCRRPTSAPRVVARRFVTNKSQEGSQFCRGFGGIGGILRYQVDLREFDADSDGPDGGEFYSSEDD